MEIDLLRGGDRSPLETPLPPASYYVTLARSDQRPYVDVWPIQLTERLPVLPVPLSAPDPAVAQAVYERGYPHASTIASLCLHRPLSPTSKPGLHSCWQRRGNRRGVPGHCSS
jgi:hypothetical protein